MAEVPTIAELIRAATRSAWHLELRDGYAVDREDAEFAAWKAGHRDNPADRGSWWRPWLDLIADATARCVEVRRARIFSEPMSEYVRFEFDGTFTNVAAGEQVRWLPRHKASNLLVSPSDFWLIDCELILWNHFDGDGKATFKEVSADPDLTMQVATAFERVWERATPHEDYRPE